MSKWLGGIVTTLIALALTSLVGALLKNPIDEFASSERIQAQVQLSPWVEKPSNKQTQRAVNEDDLSYKKILDDLLENLSRDGASDYGVARVSLENSSSSKIQDINFRLDAPYGDFDYLIIDANGSSTSSRGNRVKLSDMSPGDRVTVFMWGSFSSYLFPDKFQSYSSKGPFRSTFDWPQTEAYVYRSWAGQFLDDYAWTTFVITMILLLIVILIYLAIFSEYFKKLLKNDDFYELEKARFRSDEAAFEPDFVSGSSGKSAPTSATSGDQS